MKACLFKLAFAYNECWELRASIKSKGLSLSVPEDEHDKSIPIATYIDELVTFYKIAKSSQFPNQAFLSYYHILEYHFLRVSDEIIHSEMKSQINSISFKSDYKNVSKLIAIIKKHDNTADETEMLKAVLIKYVSEEDLIEFLQSLEKDADEKIYSVLSG